MNERLKGRTKLVVPEQFTLLQSLQLLYLLISKQYENIETQYSQINEQDDSKETAKLIKLLTSLLDKFYDGINDIEELFKCNNVLRISSWNDQETIRTIENFFILDQNIRLTRHNAKNYLLDCKTPNGISHIFNTYSTAFGISKNREKKDEEEDAYIFREADRIKKAREVEKEREFQIEKESRLLLEKSIEQKIRSQLELEYNMKIAEIQKMYISNKNLSKPKLKEVINPFCIKGPSVKKLSAQHTLLPNPLGNYQSSNVRKSLDSPRSKNYYRDDMNSQRASFDIKDIGRAAQLAWLGSLPPASSNPTKSDLSQGITSNRRSKSFENFKSTYEYNKPVLYRHQVRTNKKTSNIKKNEFEKPQEKSEKKACCSNTKKRIKNKTLSVQELNISATTDVDALTIERMYSESTRINGRINDVMNTLQGVDTNLCKQIINDIIIIDDIVQWDDIAGLHNAKMTLREVVEYPFLRPDLFKGLREPIRGLLLFGPPGTGKTMIAKAVAFESNSTFFSISASSLLSKYLGESEKLVKSLFYLAKRLAPSIIFIDEIDSVLTSRSDNENEASRRIKTELLIQWSLLSSATANDGEKEVDNRVLVLAATNLPWAIDDAARRRFARRLYIPLPEFETRVYHLKKLLSSQKHLLTENDFQNIARITDGYSGSDLTALAKEAAMQPIRELGEGLLAVIFENIRGVTANDFILAMETIKRSVSPESLKNYTNWSSKYGSTGV